MSLKVTVRSSDRVLVPEGTHRAVVADVVDLGDVDGKYGKAHKLLFVYEFDEQHPEKEVQLTISSPYD